MLPRRKHTFYIWCLIACFSLLYMNWRWSAALESTPNLLARSASVQEEGTEITQVLEEEEEEEEEEDLTKSPFVSETWHVRFKNGKSYIVPSNPISVVDEQHSEGNRVKLFPSDKRSTNPFRIVHIPKTGGSSFTTEAKKITLAMNGTVQSKESCLLGRSTTWPSYDPDINYASSVFRSPRDHVLSQYFMCLHGFIALCQHEIVKLRRPGGLKMGDLENAWKKLQNPKLPETDKESAQRRFDRVYRLAVRGLDIWLDHFLDDWYLEKGFFGCYHPLSMQVRALTCYGSWNWLHGIMRDEYLTPDVSQAISNMRSLWHIGIKEMMHESLCMLEYQYTHVLPAYCDCDSNVKRARMARDVHGVPPHSLSDLSAKQLAKIDKLVEADNAFYEASVEEFMLRLREVEARTGKRILCKSPKV